VWLFFSTIFSPLVDGVLSFVFSKSLFQGSKMPQKTIIIGSGPVGSLSCIYAAQRGHDVEIYELRSGTKLSIL
jgi:NADPH-dependent 2,4-dienoyl-CoA reductase/sulfur reductase-like enzyme